jgi:uncharacterized protein DUF3301
MLELLLDWLPVTLIAAAGWFWFDSMRAREAAVRRGKETCKGQGLLLLDETVALDAIAIARDALGRLTLCRTYRFEFSDTGNNRLNGSIVMMGRFVELVTLEPHSAYAGGETLLH